MRGGTTFAAGGDLTDVENSPAFTFLNGMAKEGKLTATQVSVFKSKYSKLHEVVLKTYDNEKELLKQAKALNNKLMTTKHQLEKSNSLSWENNTTVSNLRRDLLKAESEINIAQERDALLHVEANEMNREKGDYKAKLEQIEQLNQQLNQPKIDKLRKECQDLEEEVKQKKQWTERLMKERQDMFDKIDLVVKDTEKLEMEKMTQKQLLSKAKSEPDRIRKSKEVVQATVSNVEREVQATTREQQALEKDLKTQQKRIKELEDARWELMTETENQRAYYEQRVKQRDQVQKELEQAKEEQNVHLEKGLKLDMDIKEAQNQVKKQNEVLIRTTRDKDQALKGVRKCEFQLANAQGMVPLLEHVRENLKLELHTLTYERKKQAATLEELRNDVDVFINNYLKQEGVEGDKKDRLRRIQTEIRECEEEVGSHHEQEHDMQKEVAMLTQQREVKAREAAKAQGKLRETKATLKVKNLIIADLDKQSTEVTGRLRELCALYEMVKNERNKYVNLIQASTQALAEMKEKIKILQNEVEILRNESLDRDKALTRERLEMSHAINVRDALRTDTNKAVYTSRQKQDEVDKQIAQIDKLNSIINSAEEEMLQLKRMYELAVEDRNFAGIQLIDRNDELCILYEKLNIQENILRTGEIEFRQREEELRLDRIESKDLERSIAVARKQIKRIPELEAQIKDLLGELQEAKETSNKLSEDLEDPTNIGRWRALGGKDPSSDEILAKIQSLEQKLNDKKEQLLEKELILEEVTTLSDRLRAQASEGKKDTLELSKRVNDFQNRIKETTRKMMAIVAELSMYQATAMKLQQEAEEREEELQDAHVRMDNGEPPTEDAEREWYKLERDRLRRLEQASIKAELQRREREMGAMPAGATRTTAEARVNAYVSALGTGVAGPGGALVGGGLPRPYGQFAPLKPTEAGSSMRHIRKPKELEIEI